MTNIVRRLPSEMMQNDEWAEGLISGMNYFLNTATGVHFALLFEKNYSLQTLQ